MQMRRPPLYNAAVYKYCSKNVSWTAWCQLQLTTRPSCWLVESNTATDPIVAVFCAVQPSHSENIQYQDKAIRDIFMIEMRKYKILHNNENLVLLVGKPLRAGSYLEKLTGLTLFCTQFLDGWVSG